RRGVDVACEERRRTWREGDRRRHGRDRGRGGEAARAVGAGAARVGVRGGAGAGAGAPGALDPAAEADRLRVRRRVVRGGVTGGPAGERAGGRGAEVGGEGRTRAREAGADLPPPPGSARGPPHQLRRSDDEGRIAADRERLHPLRVSASPCETSPRLSVMLCALRVTGAAEARRPRRPRRVPLTRRTRISLQPVIPDLVEQGARAEL